MVPYEIDELAGEFNSSYAHIRRLLKRLWRQGHIQEETREVDANNGRGGRSRKKVFLYPLADDQVTNNPEIPGLLSLDHSQPKEDQVTKPAPNQHLLSLDHPPPLQVGDWVEIQTGCFSGQHVEVVGISPREKGEVEVRGKTWAITQRYQSNQLQRIRRAKP
jgi:hypothetical protein